MAGEACVGDLEDRMKRMFDAIRAWWNKPKDIRPFVVVVEPSLFRWRDTYVLGPFEGEGMARRAACRALRRHPYGEALVAPADKKIVRGKDGDPDLIVVWSGSEGAPNETVETL